MKIYIAHNYAAREVLPQAIAHLNVLGHEVTSRWITDDAHEGNNATTAQVDLDDIDRANALLFFTDNYGERPGKGKYVELGYAIALNQVSGNRTHGDHVMRIIPDQKPKIFLYGKDQSTCVFYHLPCCIHITSLEEIK